ncbi:hypothetical protein HD598_000408 [Neomicrococcus aestuarii]|uniref:Uncharacterized protein n=1 Tax=Neomicrococcus aestuarii TaxID=556325 RepID=A0A7W8TRR8_9MICC|nr:hypothetical protein [Neomicrococcus aestuarii]MBB5511721.1 hypothetical protein [Neomicrococcus aestuarii]
MAPATTNATSNAPGNQAGEQFSPQTQSDGNQPPQPDALEENNDDSQVKTFQEYVRTP